MTDVDELEARLEAMSRRVGVLEEQTEYLEDELQQRDDRIDELQAEIDTLRESTDLVNQVVENRGNGRDEKAAILLQVLARDAGEDGKASMTATEAQNNLNRSVERTSAYAIMERCVEHVGNDDVCYIKRESRSSKRNTRLIVDRSGAGELPSRKAGVAITDGGQR